MSFLCKKSINIYTFCPIRPSTIGNSYNSHAHCYSSYKCPLTDHPSSLRGNHCSFVTINQRFQTCLRLECFHQKGAQLWIENHYAS